MADDRNPTPGAPRSTAPAVDSPPAAEAPPGAESDDDTSSGTAELAELVITGTDGDGSAVSTAAPSHNGPVAGASPATPPAGPATAPASPATPPAVTAGPDDKAASKAATDGGPPAASPKPVAATPTPAPAPATPPPRALSNETPTITRPAPRPAPVPRPAPASATAPPPATPLRPPAATTPARPQADWAAEVADRIDEVVAKVRANTSERLVGIARMVVFGLLAAVMGVTALVLLTILFFRLLALIPGPLWAAYLVLGAILVGFGVFCWSRRTPKSHPA